MSRRLELQFGQLTQIGPARVANDSKADFAPSRIRARLSIQPTTILKIP
jgi:hypothetical protein